MAIHSTCPQCQAVVESLPGEEARCEQCGHAFAVAQSPPHLDPREPSFLLWILVGVGCFALLASLGAVVFHAIHSTHEAEQQRAAAEMAVAMEPRDKDRKDFFRDKDKDRKDFFVGKDKDRPLGIRKTDRRITLANGSYKTTSAVGLQEELNFLVRLEANHHYKIEMRSNQIDSFLQVVDEFGKVLASDDDGAGNLNARIPFQCRQTAEYRVRVRDLGHRAGGFDLEIRDEMFSENAIHLTFFNGQLQTTAKILAADRVDPRRNAPRKLYTVDLQANHRYALDLESKLFDTYLRIEDAGGNEVAFNDNGGLGTNSRLQYAPFQNARFRVVVTSCAGGAGEFQLSIRDLNVAPVAPPMPLPEVKKPAEPKVSDLNRSVISKALVRNGEIAVTEILGNESIRAVQWSPDDESFVVLKLDGTLSRIRSSNLFEEKRLEIGKLGLALATSSQGIVVSVSNQERLWVIDPKTFAIKKRIPVTGLSISAVGHSAAPLDFALVSSPGAAGLLRDQGKVRFLDLGTGSQLVEFGGPYRNAKLTPDGRTYFAIDGTNLRSYAVEREKFVEGPSANVSPNGKIFLSPDSKFVCVTTVSNKVTVNEVADLKKPAFHVTADAMIRAVAFDSAAKLVFALDSQGKLSVHSQAGVKLKEYAMPESFGSTGILYSSTHGGKLLVQLSNRLLYIDTEGLKSLVVK